MKKLGKKLSYFTKVLLVLSLIFSNLSSLSVVFAYEATDDFTVAVVDDNNLEIKYLEELDDTDVINIKVSENYTYLDDTSEVETIINDVATGLELTGDGVKIVSTMLSTVLFDGLYEVNVTLFNETDNVELGTVIYSDNVEFDKGLSIQVYDDEDNLISADENGIYPVEAGTDITIKSKILSGGLNPNDVYSYDEVTDKAINLLDDEFTKTVSFNGKLFGEYVIPVEVKMLNEEDVEVVFSDTVSVMYASYEMNALGLNMILSSLDEEEYPGYSDTYGFYAEDKDGILYVLSNEESIHNVLELYNIASIATSESEDISFVISNEQYEDVVLAYEEAKLLDENLTLEDFLNEIEVDDTTLLSFVTEELTITFTCVLVGDLNDDKVLSQDDLDELINQIVGTSEIDETNIVKSDVYLDDELNIFDAMYLQQILKNDTWYLEINEVEATLEAELKVNSELIVSGDEFTVDYILTVDEYAVNGISGVVEYDEELLEIVGIESSEFVGNSHDGKFLYLGDESLTGTEVEEEEQVIIEPEEYIVLTVTFKALKAGTSTIEITNPEYVNQTDYLLVTDMVISTEVIINTSSDNDLELLTINGEEITLEENVLDYEITVGNEVTTVDVQAIAKNVAASISSIVSPDELVEGKNTITIVVVAENGDEKIYTVAVIREEAPEEETATNMNYQNNDNYTQEEPVVDTPSDDVEEPEEDDLVEEDSKLSRIIIIILILLVVAGLIYLIFKDDKDDAETKKVNKEINKLKKEDITKNSNSKKTDKTKNNKKGR